MAEKLVLNAVTGIRGADFEGFIASTLFSQNWNINFRALEFDSLLIYVESVQSEPPLLLISTDLDGLTPEALAKLRNCGAKYFLFSPTDKPAENYPEAIAQPKTALDLMALIRGSLRAPLFRTPQLRKIRARTIAIGGTSGALGCTTLSINIGNELALLAKKVLVVDAHAYSPAVATLLGERGLNTSHEIRSISENYYALEITQESIVGDIALLQESLAEFDYIIVDTGILREFTMSITGRRWSSEVLIWLTLHADELWIMSKSDSLGIERLRKLLNEISVHAIKPSLTFLSVNRSQSGRGKDRDQPLLQLTTPLRPTRIWQYPWDPRSVTTAEEEMSTLHETNERSVLRKSILDISGELVR